MDDEDPLLNQSFAHITETMFNETVEHVWPYIEKKMMFWRKPLDHALHVAITLRFLAARNSYKTLDYAFSVAPNIISFIIPETCTAIVAAFGDEFLQMPDSLEGWKEIVNGFQECWNFPHTLLWVQMMGNTYASGIQSLVVHSTIIRSSFQWSCWLVWMKTVNLCSWVWELLAWSLMGVSFFSSSPLGWWRPPHFLLGQASLD